jgi:hypothetical protein
VKIADTGCVARDLKMISQCEKITRFVTVFALVSILGACGPSQQAEKAPEPRQPLNLHPSLQSRANVIPNVSTAKNVILFIGDGMGITTVTAARIFDGQSKGMLGEENVLPFENFPNLALIKTYAANQMVADSAGTASAINTGVKTSAGVISIGPEAYRRNCEGALAHPLTTLGELAEQHGKRPESLPPPALRMQHRQQFTPIRPSATGRVTCSFPGPPGRWDVVILRTNSLISHTAMAWR